MIFNQLKPYLLLDHSDADGDAVWRVNPKYVVSINRKSRPFVELVYLHRLCTDKSMSITSMYDMADDTWFKNVEDYWFSVFVHQEDVK